MGALFVRPLSFAVSSANQSSIAPASNANIDEPGLVYRSGNLTSVSVILDMGASASYDTVAIVGSNLRSSDTVQVQTGTTNTGTGSYNSSAQAAFTGSLPLGSTAKTIIKLGATRTERYIRLDFVSTGNPAGYVEAQRIVIGKALALTGGAGVNLGYEVTMNDQSIAYTGAGWRSFDRYQVLPALKLSVGTMGDVDWRNDWFGFLQSVGMNTAILCVPQDADPAGWQVDAVFGTITDKVSASVVSYGMRQVELTITALAQ